MTDINELEGVLTDTKTELATLRVRLFTAENALRDEADRLGTLARRYMADDGTPGDLAFVWGWRDLGEEYRKAERALRQVLNPEGEE